jgi:hypothetical protein
MGKRKGKKSARVFRRDYFVGSGSVMIGGDVSPAASVWERLVKTGVLSSISQTPEPSSKL